MMTVLPIALTCWLVVVCPEQPPEPPQPIEVLTCSL